MFTITTKTSSTNVFSDLNGDMFRDTTNNDVKKDIDHNAIKNSIRNILMTKKRSRRMMPTFGCDLDSILFQPVDEITANQLGALILDEIRYWEKRITIINLNITGDPEKSQYTLDLDYSINSTSISNMDRITFVLKQI